MFAIKIRSSFTERELLACPRIRSYMAELKEDADDGRTPWELLDKLDGVLLDYDWNQGEKVYSVRENAASLVPELVFQDGDKAGEEGQVFDKIQKIINRSERKKIEKQLEELRVSFDLDLAHQEFQKLVAVSFYGGKHLKTRAEANDKLALWLRKAKEIQCLAWSGEWLTRDGVVRLINESNCLEKLDVAVVEPWTGPESTLEAELNNRITLNDNRITITQVQPYTKHGRFFTLIKSCDDKEAALFTLRYGTSGCFVWTEDENDINQAKELFSKSIAASGS